jgi:hypothetical protein
MKADLRRRIARLEAKLGKGKAYEVDKWYGSKVALMSVVAFHAGKLSSGESLATAFACALGMTSYDLNNALRRDNYDGPEVWPLVLEKLNTLIAARAGRPILENGSLGVFSKDRARMTIGATASKCSANSIRRSLTRLKNPATCCRFCPTTLRWH